MSNSLYLFWDPAEEFRNDCLLLLFWFVLLEAPMSSQGEEESPVAGWEGAPKPVVVPPNPVLKLFCLLFLFELKLSVVFAKFCC